MLHEQRILFAQDFSESSRQALPLGLDLARRTGAELHVVHADVLHTEPINRGVDGPDHNVDLERRLRRLTEEQAPGTYDLGQMVLRHAVVRDVAPAPGLLNFADEHDVDLIMMGTHGRRGVDRLLLGSVAEEVARLANCPVMTVREQEAERPARAVERILVPIDYSDHSAVVLRMLASWPPTTAPGWICYTWWRRYCCPSSTASSRSRWLATRCATAPGRVSSTCSPVPPAPTFGSGTRRLRAPRQRHPRRGPRLQHRPDRAGYARAHGRTGVPRLLLGSIAEKVVRMAPCPIFTVMSFGKRLLDVSAAEPQARVVV